MCFNKGYIGLVLLIGVQPGLPGVTSLLVQGRLAMTMTRLAKRIRALRYSKGWGPDELADRANISRTALYQIECGKTETPRAGTLIRIARALNLSVEDLVGAESSLSLEDRAASFSTDPLIQLAYSGSLAEKTREPGRAAGFEGSSEVFSTRELVGKEFSMASGVSVTLDQEIGQKLSELLESPLADSVIRLIEETYRLIPDRAERYQQLPAQG